MSITMWFASGLELLCTDSLIFWCTMYLFISDSIGLKIPTVFISVHYAKHIKYIINILEKKKENVLECFGSH